MTVFTYEQFLFFSMLVRTKCSFGTGGAVRPTPGLPRADVVFSDINDLLDRLKSW